MAFSDLEKRKHKNLFIEKRNAGALTSSKNLLEPPQNYPGHIETFDRRKICFFFLFQSSKLEIVCILNATVFSIQMILLRVRQSLLLGEVSKKKQQTNKLNNSVKDKLMLGSRGLL